MVKVEEYKITSKVTFILTWNTTQRQMWWHMSISPYTGESEACRLLWIQNQHGLHRKILSQIHKAQHNIEERGGAGAWGGRGGKGNSGLFFLQSIGLASILILLNQCYRKSVRVVFLLIGSSWRVGMKVKKSLCIKNEVHIIHKVSPQCIQITQHIFWDQNKP